MAKDTTSTKKQTTTDSKTNQQQTVQSSGLNMETVQLLLGLNNKNDIATSFMDSITNTKDNIELTLKDIINDNKGKKLIRDAYGNELSSTGTDDKVKSFTNYGFSNDTLNYLLWLSLYNDSWVFKKVIDKPAQDMVNAGIKLICKSDKQQLVYKEIKLLRQSLIELISWGRLFGGAVALMMFDKVKDEDYIKPLDKNVISKSKVINLYVTDRWFGCATSSETVDDMKSIDFGTPKYYSIVFASGKTIKVHHSYILRMEGRTAPKLIKTGQLQGWGYAEGAHILNELSRDDQLKSSVTSLVNKALIEVVKMAGMRGVFLGADEDNEKQLRKRLEMVNWARTFNSLTFLDKEDEYEQREFSGTSGLAALLETNMKIVAASVDMPTILFGDLADGFSKDSDAFDRYDEIIKNLNESYFNKPMTKLINTLYIKNGIDEAVEFEFNSLIPDVKMNKKVDSLSKMVDLLSKLLADGVITIKKYAESLNTYTQNSAIDLHLDSEYVDKLDDKMEEEMENIDLNNV